MKGTTALAAFILALLAYGHIQAQSTFVPVTVDNFIRAKSDKYIAGVAKKSGGLGKLHHDRAPASIDNQTTIRLNRDTLYSSAVFDLDAGPVTFTLPDAGKRFQSLQIVSQDHYATTDYGAGPHAIDKDKVGTRGYYEKNSYDAYTINNLTARKSSDGSVAIQFGGCDGNIPNCLPIVGGWNYTVRLYRPREEILNGTWKFPQPQPQ